MPSGDEVRDEVAKLLGWRRNRSDGNPCGWLTPNTWIKGDPGNEGWSLPDEQHPVPSTIDGIAALWPERVGIKEGGSVPPLWEVRCISTGYTAMAWTGAGASICQVKAPTEYEARLALLLAVLREGSGG